MVGIGFFAPFPLALMIPFMAGQSLAMGEAFGKGFQYGKRKISSMSNEEFNALNFQQLSESIATDYKVMIPSIQKSIQASEQLQRTVLQEMGQLIKTIPSEILNFFGSLVNQPTTTNTSGITNVRLNRNQDIQADRDRIANDLKIAEQKILEFTYGVLNDETLADAKRRADAKTKQDKIDAQTTVKTGRTGERQFTIVNPSIETGTASKFTPSIVKTFKKLERAPRSIVNRHTALVQQEKIWRSRLVIANRERDPRNRNRIRLQLNGVIAAISVLTRKYEL